MKLFAPFDVPTFVQIDCVENGRDEIYDPVDPIDTTLNDFDRIKYYFGYLDNVAVSFFMLVISVAHCIFGLLSRFTFDIFQIDTSLLG